MSNHREAFEAWVNGQFQISYSNDAPLEKDDGSGDFYEDHRVNNAWCGWQAAIEAQAQQTVTAEEYLLDKYGAYRGHHEWRALEDAFNAGKAAQANIKAPDNKWISVDERLPEGGKSVLVVTNFGEIYTCRLPVIIVKNAIEDSDGLIRERFTHWIPLPPAPEGGDK